MLWKSWIKIQENVIEHRSLPVNGTSTLGLVVNNHKSYFAARVGSDWVPRIVRHEKSTNLQRNKSLQISSNLLQLPCLHHDSNSCILRLADTELHHR